MLRLPLDFSVFKEMREMGYLYVDKTRHAYNLLTQGKYYFFSRPRRFGKSLFISMLKEVLSGQRDLFKGLWIEQSDYPWQEHGVIVLDFSCMGITNKDTFEQAILQSMQRIIDQYKLTIDIHALSSVWALISVAQALHKKFGKVALLIDEYDNPILHALKDIPRAEEIRDAMQGFFAAIKGLGEYINFVLITGVSSFAKAGLFSGINNLRIVTLNPKYETICGYTQEEVDHYFTDYITAWGQEKDFTTQALSLKIKEYYNGYAFSSNAIQVYNPFSLMHALDTQQFENFWIKTGTPTFLMHELEKEYRQDEYHLFNPEKFTVSRELLGSFDVGTTPLPALLFQAGYLTIRDHNEERDLFFLGYPNIEVQEAMQKYLISVFARVPVGIVEDTRSSLEFALQNENIDEAVRLLQRLFMHIPYQLHVKEEKFYHALFTYDLQCLRYAYYL